jgi:predicted small lipoprotein YifL
MPCTLALLLAASLAGCGYKAPLFMPKPKSETPRRGTVIAPDPAPERPAPADAAPAPQ